MNRHFILSLLLCILLPFALHSQAASNDQMSITSFALDPTDVTANLQGTTVIDQNGEKCALLKIRTTETGFAFSFGMTKPVKIEYKTAEVWVYVPHGVKKMTIQHPQLGTLEYDIPVQINKASTYKINLVSARVKVVVETNPGKQFVVFKLIPSNAVVELGGNLLEVVDGTAQKYLSFGTYSYRVQAKNYYPYEGKVIVNNPDEKVLVNVNLTPAFGYISIPDTPTSSGAAVFIDDKYVGTVPFKSEAISKGPHAVRLSKSLYKNWIQTVMVSDGGSTQTLTPVMDRNYAEVRVVVASGAEFYLDGESKGVGSWSGKLECGSHLLEVKKDGHRPKAKSIDIFPEPLNQTIQMPEPEPIYGYAVITSTPISSKVMIDGKDAGETPVQKKLLIGKHKVVLSKGGYASSTIEVDITENGCAEKHVNLQKASSAAASGAAGGADAPKAIAMGGAAVVAGVDGQIAGRSYVDLGLSVKWASCNVGASKPEDYGRYFAWGDVEGQVRYASEWSRGGFTDAPSHEQDSHNNLKLAYDAAHVQWGGTWRMPTKAEFQELLDNCKCVWTKNYNNTGINGYLYISKKPGYAGKSIFLPAGGYGGSALNDVGEGATYWSSTNDYEYAYELYFNGDNTDIRRTSHRWGQSVRPVSE